jgi:hypothetical protein
MATRVWDVESLIFIVPIRSVSICLAGVGVGVASLFAFGWYGVPSSIPFPVLEIITVLVSPYLLFPSQSIPFRVGVIHWVSVDGRIVGVRRVVVMTTILEL